MINFNRQQQPNRFNTLQNQDITSQIQPFERSDMTFEELVNEKYRQKQQGLNIDQQEADTDALYKQGILDNNINELDLERRQAFAENPLLGDPTNDPFSTQNFFGTKNSNLFNRQGTIGPMKGGYANKQVPINQESRARQARTTNQANSIGATSTAGTDIFTNKEKQ